MVWVRDNVTFFWERYINLVQVKEENEQLKRQLDTATSQLARAAEEHAEVERLRTLLSIDPPEGWRVVGARVLASRFGPQAALESLTLGKGYLQGASPGTPVVNHVGIIGRVFRAGPNTSVTLLLTDPGSRIAVVSQKNRTQGILVGSGPRQVLEMRYVPHNAVVEEGEMLVTSGLEGAFPKGLPVARVNSVRPSDLSLFQTVQAIPLTDPTLVEEVMLLQRPTPRPGTIVAPVYTPATAPATPAPPTPRKPRAGG